MIQRMIQNISTDIDTVASFVTSFSSQSDPTFVVWKRVTDFAHVETDIHVSSLHELVCAVQASWITLLPAPTNRSKQILFLMTSDLNLGPSRPGTRQPPLLGKKEDAVVIALGGDIKKLVVALAITEEDGRPISVQWTQ